MKRPIASLAKLSPPRLPKIVERKRLYKVLDAARQRPIIWVTAPPGTGKTTLAASYLQARKLKSLWYQMDEGDSDPATLFHYLGLASKKATPRYRQPLPHLTPEYLPGLPTFTRRFFEQLYQRMKTPSILVLDNFHVLEAAEKIHELLKIALEIIPEGIQVFVLSRQPAPPIFSRFLAMQTMQNIHENTLFLTLQETTDLVALKQGKKKRPTSGIRSRELFEHTKGWIAGAILTLEHGTALKENLEELLNNPEVLFDYLAQEIMNELPRETQDVLLKTAFAPSFTILLVEELSQNPNAALILADLFRRRYFLEQYGESPFTYQFHPLFKMFLQKLSQEQFSQEETKELKRKTGMLLQREGHYVEAANLFQTIGAHDELHKLALEHAQLLFTEGRSQTIEKWLMSLPDKNLDNDPWSLLLLGNCRRMTNLRESEAILKQAFCGFEISQNTKGMMRTCVTLIEVIIWSWSDWSRADQWLEKLHGLGIKSNEESLQENHSDVIMAMCSILSWRRPADPHLPYWIKQGECLLEASPSFLEASLVGHVLMSLYLTKGHIAKAGIVLNNLRRKARSHQNFPLVKLSYFFSEAHYAWYVGDRLTCNKVVSKGMAYGRETGCLLMEIHLQIQLFYGALIDYDLEVAEKILKEIYPSIQDGQGILEGHYQALLGWLAYFNGHVDHAGQCLHEGLNAARLSGAPFPEGLVGLLFSQVLYAQGHIESAREQIRLAEKIGEQIESALLIFMTQLTNAYFALQEDQDDVAKKALTHGIKLARERGLLYFSWWPKNVVAQLCAKALEWDIEVEFVQTLVRKFQLMPEQLPVDNANWPWKVKISTLGHFQIEVDDQSLSFAEKTPKRVLALLKALIAFGGKDVAETKLSDALWPDADGDLAHQTFATTLHRLRRLLGSNDVLVLKDGKLSLNPNLCWVDTWAFQAATIQSDEKTESQIVETLSRLVNLYGGPFIPDNEEEPWSFLTRERLRSQFIRTICQLASRLSTPLHIEMAIPLLTKALDYEPSANPLHQQLVNLFTRLNRQDEIPPRPEPFPRVISS